GLAGLRLGFALAGLELAARLGSALGPWAVAGPAIAIGQTALSDTSWAEATRNRLSEEAMRLSELLTDSALAVIGGTSLFRLAQAPSARQLFNHLGRVGTLVRSILLSSRTEFRADTRSVTERVATLST